MTEAGESATSQAVSGSPLDLLPLRQFFVVMARAHGRPMTETATVLGIHRDTVYQDLDAALKALRRVPARVKPPVVAPPDPAYAAAVYGCATHGSECPKSCAYLKDWLTAFERQHPTVR